MVEAEVVVLMNSGIAHGFYYEKLEDAEALYNNLREIEGYDAEKLMQINETGDICIRPIYIESIRIDRKLKIKKPDTTKDKKERYVVAGYR